MMKRELSVYEDFMGQLIDRFEKHITGVKFDYESFGDSLPKWTRINRCEAWFTRVDSLIFVKSYNTIVAVYDGKTLYSNGRYSMTTYQHIRKFRNNYTADGYMTPEVNLERVNWF